MEIPCCRGRVAFKVPKANGTSGPGSGAQTQQRPLLAKQRPWEERSWRVAAARRQDVALPRLPLSRPYEPLFPPSFPPYVRSKTTQGGSGKLLAVFAT